MANGIFKISSLVMILLSIEGRGYADTVLGPGANVPVIQTPTANGPATTSPPMNSTASGIINGDTTATSQTSQLNGISISSAPSQNAAATSSSNGNGMTSLISYGVGGALIYQGTPMVSSCPEGPQCAMGVTLLLMGAYAVEQGFNSDGSSTQNSNIANQTAAGPITTDPSNPNLAAKSAAQVQLTSAIANLKSAGVSFNPATGLATLPNGKTVSPSDISSSSAMGSAVGVSPSDYQKAMATAAAAEKKIAADLQKSTAYTAANGFDAGSSGAGLPGDGTDPNAAVSTALTAKRAPANASGKTGVAGMARNYNGDMIGVAGDDIFQMMTRRYQEKVKNQSFLSPEALPTGTAQALPSLMPMSH